MTDTHDTNLPEKQVELAEEKQTAEVLPTPETSAEETVQEKTAEVAQKLSKAEILEKLKQLAADVENAKKAEIDSLKQAFYKLHNAEQEAAKQQFIENGGAAEEFVPQHDSAEDEFKKAMSVIKEKRNELAAEQEKQKELNYQVKLSIIEELKELTESPDDANKNFTEFKKLQQQWNEVTLVPQAKVNELWKNYQLYVEKFYDLLKLNNEFREYDFKKNLEIKTHLCEAAEKLADEPDVISAFHQLQKLHAEFRDTGPVAKELREEIWARFKAASTVVNRRHQQHFEAQKEVEAVIREEGEAAALEVGVHGIHPELIKLLGRMKFRTSYGQNALKHSMEVAQLAGLLAGEIGLDVRVAKRAGLLHDIGKSIDHDVEGSHIQIGVDLCRKYKESATVVNAVEAHHGDVEPQTLIACVVQAADTISAARPGARRETLETYTNRLKQLEDITNQFKGVDKSFAIQAGREIRVMVVPEQVSDADMVLMARDIAKQIEYELEYPGQIKVNVIRESRVTDYAK